MGSNAKIFHWSSCLSVVVHIIISQAIAQPQGYFEHFGIENRLSQHSIMDLLQKRKGFMRFAIWTTYRLSHDINPVGKSNCMSVWGMDNMKVGNTLGLGSIAYWDGSKAVRVEKRDSVICLIPTDGKIRSQVFTTYYGWDTNGIKCNLQSLITIDAGSRASRMELKADKNIDNIATGIIKDDNAELIIPKQTSGEWSYIATFGKQSLNNDMMGLAVFYKTKQLVKITEDSLNHVIILKPVNGHVDYYFMPTWELDWDPVKDKAAFEKCIDEVLNRLNNHVSYAIHP